MPTYDYQCTACGHRFERFHGPKESVDSKCPACGKKKVERLLGTGGGIIFRGSGFYETDYRSDSYQQAAKKDQVGPSKAGECSGTPASCDGPCKTGSPD